jgi:hypothetical protein
MTSLRPLVMNNMGLSVGREEEELSLYETRGNPLASDITLYADKICLPAFIKARLPSWSSTQIDQICLMYLPVFWLSELHR